MSNLRVFKGSRQSNTEMAGELAERIMDVVLEYENRIALASVIGVLEIVKHELINDNE